MTRELIVFNTATGRPVLDIDPADVPEITTNHVPYDDPTVIVMVEATELHDTWRVVWSDNREAPVTDCYMCGKIVSLHEVDVIITDGEGARVLVHTDMDAC